MEIEDAINVAIKWKELSELNLKKQNYLVLLDDIKNQYENRDTLFATLAIRNYEDEDYMFEISKSFIQEYFQNQIKKLDKDIENLRTQIYEF